MRRRARVSNCGFNLLELVLVSAIVAIFAAMAIPRYGSASSRYRLDLAARRVAADLRLAQMCAKTSSSSCTMVFNAATEQYTIMNLPAPDGLSGSYQVALLAEPYKAELLSVNFNDSSQVVFNGWGLPDSGGTVTVAAGSQQKTITVDSGTGRIDVQ